MGSFELDLAGKRYFVGKNGCNPYTQWKGI